MSKMKKRSNICMVSTSELAAAVKNRREVSSGLLTGMFVLSILKRKGTFHFYTSKSGPEAFHLPLNRLVWACGMWNYKRAFQRYNIQYSFTDSWPPKTHA